MKVQAKKIEMNGCNFVKTLSFTCTVLHVTLLISRLFDQSIKQWIGQRLEKLEERLQRIESNDCQS